MDEIQKIYSNSRYNEIKKSQRNYFSMFKCSHCKEIEVEKDKKAKKEAHQLFLQKFDQALKKKNWNNLNQFEREVLSSCLEMTFDQLKKKYGGQLGRENFIKLIKALEKISDQDLIHLIRNRGNNYIASYQYLQKLTEFIDEIKPPKKITPSSVQIDSETNESIVTEKEIHFTKNEKKIAKRDYKDFIKSNPNGFKQSLKSFQKQFVDVVTNSRRIRMNISNVILQ